MKRLLIFGAALALGLGAATAASPAPGPLDESGTLAGANYRIIVPAHWNGGLVVLAHGYRDRADHPGEVDDRTAMDAGFAALAGGLASVGYAVAGTSYSRNGWAVKDALGDLTALTSYFDTNIAEPNRTLLVGFSLGSIPTLELAERGGLFDGFLPACAVAAGSPRAWDGAAVSLLAYQVAFGGGLPAAWGTVADGNDTVDFETQVFPVVLGQLLNPLNFGKFEFMRLVAGVPASPAYYGAGLMTNMFFFTEARGDLEQDAGGPVVQNVTHFYSLSAGDKAYLSLLGVNADALLAQMNAQRNIAAPPSSRNYLEHYADFTGKIKKPVLTMHTEIDTLVPVQHEAAYAATVHTAGNDALLYQTYTTGIGHCNFTPQQTLTAIGALDTWVQTGARPVASEFPAALGFDSSFVPPPWPQP
jgi:hypothetical protein